MRKRLDALIVGGGPAGAAFGTLLARAGRSTLIIEQSAVPHDKVCGDFLSYEAIQYLRALECDLPGLGAAAISKVRLAASGLIGECELPFTAMSLTRRALDEELLARAKQAGTSVLRGRRVESLRGEDAGWTARLSGGEEVHAADAFIATGKHNLRGWPREAGRQNDLVAFKMYFRVAAERQAELAGNVDLILFSGGYAGLQLVEQGAANLCLVVRRRRLQKCCGQWGNILQYVLSSSPYLARILDGANSMLEKPLALSSIPYGYISSGTTEGLWRLGDQAAVIPSFSGDGISIALHSAHVAASDYLMGKSAGAFQRRLFGQLRPAMSAATTLSRLMVAVPALAQGIRLRPQLLRAIATETRICPAELLAKVL